MSAITLLQIVSFIVAMTGIIVIIYKDNEYPQHIGGCTLVMLATGCGAMYKVGIGVYR